MVFLKQESIANSRLLIRLEAHFMRCFFPTNLEINLTKCTLAGDSFNVVQRKANNRRSGSSSFLQKASVAQLKAFSTFKIVFVFLDKSENKIAQQQ